jgi:hypothetical protein
MKNEIFFLLKAFSFEFKKQHSKYLLSAGAEKKEKNG